MSEIFIPSNDQNQFERRRWPRQPSIADVCLRRIKPPLPTIQHVYTKDLTAYGACLFIPDNVSWQPNDEMSIVFVIRLKPSNLIRLHWKYARVAWSNNGRIGIEFLRKDQIG